MKSIQGCYNKELKRDPSLRGKVEIEFTIGENGRIEEALTVGNTMGQQDRRELHLENAEAMEVSRSLMVAASRLSSHSSSRRIELHS